MSGAAGALDSACDLEAVPLTDGLPFPQTVFHPDSSILGICVSGFGGGRKMSREILAILARKKCFINAVGSVVNGLCREGETTLSHWACSYRCPANQSSRKHFRCQHALHSAGLGGKPCSAEKHSPEEAMTPAAYDSGQTAFYTFPCGVGCSACLYNRNSICMQDISSAMASQTSVHVDKEQTPG